MSLLILVFGIQLPNFKCKPLEILRKFSIIAGKRWLDRLLKNERGCVNNI
jgi:hypothetical protein